MSFFLVWFFGVGEEGRRRGGLGGRGWGIGRERFGLSPVAWFERGRGERMGEGAIETRMILWARREKGFRGSSID